jgi:ketosteroid isomerase-like protein
MSDEQIKGAIRGFLKAMTAGDKSQMTSFLSPDVVWIGPSLKYTGPAEIWAYIEKLRKIAPDFAYTENGMGIVVQGTTAVIEHDLSGTTNGKKWVLPATCVYQFKGDKIQNMRTFYDRLSLAQQSVKGWLPSMAVNMVANGMAKQMK